MNSLTYRANENTIIATRRGRLYHPTTILGAMWLVASLILSSCQPLATAEALAAEPSSVTTVETSAVQKEKIEAQTEVETTRGETTVSETIGAGAPGSYLLRNQRWVEGLRTDVIDLEDVDEVFWHVFSSFPNEVTVYPSENYYYFILYVNGRQIWGNVRLPAGRRDRGVLSFGYFEFIEFPSGGESGLSKSKFFTRADGLIIDKVDRFTYDVSYDDKTIRFNLHQLSQEEPEQLTLGENEIFIQRTFDESGYEFYLLYNEKSNYFFWVLNEEREAGDIFTPVSEELVVGKRSGFAFWVDEAHDNRKVLVAIRRLSVTRNDYYDGPFDQLADNYADEVGISEYMQRAFPALRGRIDKYGYYTDRERPMRVALSTYYTYFTISDLLTFMERVLEAEDPYSYISRRGVE
ncbi:hypothetical protein KFU94_32515 [Chloroflexi bacterium TSY]|nr:hypothetical protein [Chloroflexi bacterium TSY]